MRTRHTVAGVHLLTTSRAFPPAQTLRNWRSSSWFMLKQSQMADKPLPISPHHQNQQTLSRKKRKRILQIEPVTLKAPNPAHISKHKKIRRRTKSEIREDTRKWGFSSRDCSNYTDKFVFVSYNILGVENASKHKDLYFNVPSKYLDWERRKRLIRKEIARYDPSILCFQEVDRFDDLENILQQDGFRGVYQARTGEACDGCAIFWKDELFSLLHEDNIEFKQFGLRDNVAQFCVLKMNGRQTETNVNAESLLVQPSRSLVVGNIHVLFNPSRGDIKLGQVRLFLAKAHKLSETWGNIPVILGGDLNSMPQSAMYQFIASSELNIQHHERKGISGQICPLEYPMQSQNNIFSRHYRPFSRPFMHRWSNEELRLATGTGGSSYLRHNLKLYSAYQGVPGSCLTRDNYGEPSATSFHSRFMGTVDYIWHTEELVPVKVLETLPIDILRKTRGLPSKRWGSDHLALVCEMAFADDLSVT